MLTHFARTARTISLSLLCWGTALSPAQETGLPDAAIPDFGDWADAAMTGSGEVAFGVFRQAAERGRGNVVLSPASIGDLLRLLREVAAGDSRAALDAVDLGAPDTSPALESAAALFADSSLRLNPAPPAVELRRAPLKNDPAEAAAAVDRWCAERTDGRIPSVASAGAFRAKPDMAAFATLLFKGRWEAAFDEKVTEDVAFHQADGRDVPVRLMQRADLFHYAEDGAGEWRAIAIPYRTGEWFIGILPAGDAREFVRELTLEKYRYIVGVLERNAPQNVRLHLPCLDLETEPLPLRGLLVQAGVPDVFSGPFHSVLSAAPLQIGGVYQRCTVEIGHKGTVAAAVTSSPMVIVGLRPTQEPVVMRFDRPFVWAVGRLDPSALPWFVGLVEEVPGKGE